MPEILEQRNSIIPVTSLAIAHNSTTTLLLAGQGSVLSVYEFQTSRLLRSLRVFQSRVVHGIALHEACEPGIAGSIGHSVFLVWGAKSACIVQWRYSIAEHEEEPIDIRVVVKETCFSDWIIDACFLPPLHQTAESVTTPATLEAAFLTSHNVLLSATINNPVSPNACYTLSTHRLVAGPMSVLYSAHVRFLQNGQLLVAAGTVFGDVHVWRCERVPKITESGVSSTSHSLYSFSGHEGSVFGVRILDDDCWGHNHPVVASCSDDRTIRIWDISRIATLSPIDGSTHSVSPVGETDFKPAADSIHAGMENACLGRVMGHASRIWSLRFLPDVLGTRRLLSFGEDATTQLWRMKAPTKTRIIADEDHSTLLNEGKFMYHNGKSVWSATVRSRSEGVYEVSTGGADGGIMLFKIGSGDYRKHLELKDKASKPLLGRSTFESLQGSWKLHRVLYSAIPTFPSGIFRGIAKLLHRPATDPQYDEEYLYAEEGTLETEQGLCLRGSRQYVYRYQRSTDLITAWFVKADGKTVDYYFHTVRFEENSDLRRSENLQAKDNHLCVEDLYEVQYQFRPRSNILSNWSVQYQVTGPKKDYHTATEYIKILSNAEEIKAIQSSGLRRNKDDTFSHWNGISHIKAQEKTNSFKGYTWIGAHEILATTLEGKIMLSSVKAHMDSGMGLPEGLVLHNLSWTNVSQISDLESHSIILSIRHTGVALLSGASGVIYRYQHGSTNLTPLAKLPTKISSLFAQDLTNVWGGSLPNGDVRILGIIGTCPGSNVAFAFKNSLNQPMDDHNSSKIIQLELPKKFTVTSASWCERDNLIVLGSRDGALKFYIHSSSGAITTIIEYSCFVEDVHGRDAITSIVQLPRKDETDLYILTTGRDGKFAIHKVVLHEAETAPNIHFSTLHISEPSFGPNVEGAFFDNLTKELILWGFRSKEFVVWNDTRQKETMVVECGGSHRNWAYRPTEGKDGGHFVWTKASTGYAHLQAHGSHRVIQSGCHGREIKAVAVNPKAVVTQTPESALVATGAEDTTIRIFIYIANYTASHQAWKCRAIIKNHTTGVQKLQWSPDGKFLFSAGGCEELFAWRIRTIPYIDVGIVQSGECPKVTKASHLRIMDFNVTALPKEHEFLVSTIYSDSTLRLWNFNASTHPGVFSLLSTSTYSTNCLTLVLPTLLHFGAYEKFFLTASTDGHIAAWAHLPDNSLTLQARHRIHQSSIKSGVLLTLRDENLIVATAGDDGAIAFTRMRHEKTPSSSNGSELLFSTLLIPKAHASAVTVILDITPSSSPSSRPGGFTLATTGPDQRLKTWFVTVDATRPGVEGVSVRKGGNVYSEVADASCLALMNRVGAGVRGEEGGEGDDGDEEAEGKFKGKKKEEKGRGVLVVGIGMEVLRI